MRTTATAIAMPQEPQIPHPPSSLRVLIKLELTLLGPGTRCRVMSSLVAASWKVASALCPASGGTAMMLKCAWLPPLFLKCRKRSKLTMSLPCHAAWSQSTRRGSGGLLSLASWALWRALAERQHDVVLMQTCRSRSSCVEQRCTGCHWDCLWMQQGLIQWLCSGHVLYPAGSSLSRTLFDMLILERPCPSLS